MGQHYRSKMPGWRSCLVATLSAISPSKCIAKTGKQNQKTSSLLAEFLLKCFQVAPCGWAGNVKWWASLLSNTLLPEDTVTLFFSQPFTREASCMYSTLCIPTCTSTHTEADEWVRLLFKPTQREKLNAFKYIWKLELHSSHFETLKLIIFPDWKWPFICNVCSYNLAD